MGQLKIIENNDLRVLTTSQLAGVYGTDHRVISNNFTRNKNRYTEGKHFVILSGNERREFLDHHQIDDSSKHAKYIYLWTAKGALLHAKSLGTDEAWHAYEQLVDDYFNKVEQLQVMNVPTQLPTTIEDILITALTNMKEMKFENAELKKAVKHLEVVVDNEVWLTEHQKADVKQAVNSRVGYLKSERVECHFQTIFSALNAFFNVSQYNKIPRKDYGQAMEFVKGFYPKKKSPTPDQEN